MTYNAEERRQKRWAQRDSRELIDGRLVATKANAHGSVSTYGNWGCRCVPCTEAHTVEHNKWRRARHAKRVRVGGVMVAVDAPVHNASTYTNWGCRCRPCTEAFSADCGYLKRKREGRK